MQQAAENNAELVQRIFEGDKRAEAEFVARYETSLRLILYKRTKNPQLARDVCQEALMTTLLDLRAGKVRQPDSLAAYLRRVAINLSIQHFRKEKRVTSADDVVIDLHTYHDDVQAAQIDSGRVRGILDTILGKLATPRDREILRRFYLREDDKRAICDSMSLKPEHFDRVLFRAKQRMRRLIEEQDGLKQVLFRGLLDD